MRTFAEICDEEFGYKVSNDVDFDIYQKCADIFANQPSIDLSSIDLEITEAFKERCHNAMLDAIENTSDARYKDHPLKK